MRKPPHAERDPMNISAQTIRTIVAATAFGLVAGLNAQAFGTISPFPTNHTTPVGISVVAPVPGVRIDAEGQSKQPLIRVAPACPGCRGFEDEEFGG
jgi:hypothetical protein